MLTASIIAPVYNVEKYLNRCLDSILNQNFSDYEILLIDDGSTDDSGKICDDYASKDPRIRVFHKQNGGVSSTRNLGIEHAKGEWLLFIDSDDEIIEDSLGKLFESSSEVDLITTEPIHIFNGKAAKSPLLISRTFTPEQYAFCLLTTYNGLYQGYDATKVFKRSIIIENNLRFDSDITYNEDRLFVMRYLCKCTKVLYADSQFYIYHHREDSAMGINEKSISQKSITELYAFQRMIDCIKTSKLTDKSKLIRHCNFGIISSSDILLDKCTRCDLCNEINRIKLSVPFFDRLWFYCVRMLVSLKRRMLTLLAV